MRKSDDFVFAFTWLAKQVNQNAHDKGFYPSDDINDGEKIALMHSELSEALESVRKGEPMDSKVYGFTETEVELADCIIRIADYAAQRNLRVAQAIIEKHKYNTTRPHKHGKEF